MDQPLDAAFSANFLGEASIVTAQIQGERKAPLNIIKPFGQTPRYFVEQKGMGGETRRRAVAPVAQLNAIEWPHIRLCAAMCGFYHGLYMA